jgi:hypothetical protein
MQALVQATAVMEKISSDRARMITMRAELSAKLETVERSAGERYLAGDRSQATEMVELKSELGLVERALETLEARAAAAQFDLKRATAGDLRHQAREKEKELKGLQERVAPLLSKLSDLLDVRYDQGILAAQRTGIWIPYPIEVVPTLPLECRSPLDVGPDPLNNTLYAVPLTNRLRAQIKQLELEAALIENQLATESAAPAPSSAALPGRSQLGLNPPPEGWHVVPY